jgi:hypothetical protein
VSLINPYRYQTALSTPTLDTATAWWTPGDYDATPDAFLEQRGTGLHAQRGDSTGAGVRDPAIADDGTYNIAQFRRVTGQEDHLITANNAAFNLGTGDFMICMVVKPAALAGAQSILLAKRATVSANGFMCVIRLTSNGFAMLSQGGNAVEHSATLNTSTIYRVAWGRTSGQAVVIVDGVASSTVANTNNLDNTEPLYHGRRTDSAGADFDWYGTSVFKGVAPTTGSAEAACGELLAAAAL